MCHIVYRTPLTQVGAVRNPDKVHEYLKDELSHRSILGPFDNDPFHLRGSRISPIDAIPKKDSVDLRIILNLSFPPEGGDAVNDAIDKNSYLGKPTNLTYPTIDDLCTLIRLFGPGCALMKTDLKKYYRQIFYDPGDVHLTGFRFEGKFYWDIALSMGLRIACYIAQRISNALMFVFATRGHSGVNYLDDLAAAAR